MSNKIREPKVSGMFYPDNSADLKSYINNLLSGSKVEFNSNQIFGLVSPHAGYAYSGSSAAAGYNTLMGRNIKTAIIISPSHREYFPGISIYEGSAYKTPLGTVEINSAIREKMTSGEKFLFPGIEGHGAEHALEVQIPFLQTVLSDFDIVPIVMGDQRKEFVDILSRALAGVWEPGVVIIASSDLSHFHSRTAADRLDSLVEQRIKNFEHEELLADLELRNSEACGGGGIAALLKTALKCGYNKSEILSRTDSGEVTQDLNEVVGYLSAVIYK